MRVSGAFKAVPLGSRKRILLLGITQSCCNSRQGADPTRITASDRSKLDCYNEHVCGVSRTVHQSAIIIGSAIAVKYVRDVWIYEANGRKLLHTTVVVFVMRTRAVKGTNFPVGKIQDACVGRRRLPGRTVELQHQYPNCILRE
jgi:hypothetical protein